MLFHRKEGHRKNWVDNTHCVIYDKGVSQMTSSFDVRDQVHEGKIRWGFQVSGRFDHVSFMGKYSVSCMSKRNAL